MGDVALRELERRWCSTGDMADRAAFLRARVQSGALPEWKVRLASYCRDPAAAMVVGNEEADPPIDETRFQLARDWKPTEIVARPVELRATETFKVDVGIPEFERWARYLLLRAPGRTPLMIALLALCDCAAERAAFHDGVIRHSEAFLRAPTRANFSGLAMAGEATFAVLDAAGETDEEGTFWTKPLTAAILPPVPGVDDPAPEEGRSERGRDAKPLGGVLMAAFLNSALRDAFWITDDVLQRTYAEDPSPKHDQYKDRVVSSFPRFRRRIEEWLIAWALDGELRTVRPTLMENEADPRHRDMRAGPPCVPLALTDLS